MATTASSLKQPPSSCTHAAYSSTSSSSSTQHHHHDNKTNGGDDGSRECHGNDDYNYYEEQPPLNAVRLCGWSTSRCGYCHGDRAHLLQNQLQDDSVMTSSLPLDESKQEDATNEYSNKKNKNDSKQQNGHKPTNDSNQTTENTATTTNDPESIKSSSSRSYGTHFQRLHCLDYQLLIDRGWRRSGKHLYLPDNWKSCCPAIPIRLDVTKFKADKGQRRVWRNMESCLTPPSAAGGLDAVAAAPSTTVHVQKSRKLSTEAVANEKHHGSMQQQQRVVAKKQSSFVNVSRYVTDEILQSLQSGAMHSISCVIHPDGSETIISNLNKLCTFKFNKKATDQLAKQRKKKKKQKQPSTDVSGEEKELVVCSTTACCAIGGRSHGTIRPAELAHSVVKHWNASSSSSHDYSMETDATSRSNQGNTFQNTNNENSIQITAVEALPSGHINATLSLSIPPQQTKQTDNRMAFTSLHDVNKSSTKMSPPPQPSELVDHLARLLGLNPNTRHILTVRSVPSEISANHPEVHELFCRYQKAVHGDYNPFIDDITDADQSIDDEEDEEEQQEEDNHDEVYAIDETDSTHNPLPMHDASTRCEYARSKLIGKAKKSFVRFLVDSPLPSVAKVYERCALSSTSCYSNHKKAGRSGRSNDRQGAFDMDEEGYDIHIPYGSYHQQYRIDNILIAVGVVDILPYCLSSVYSFYDPILSGDPRIPFPIKLHLGKYTALREIEWVKRAMKYRQSLKFYYLGYYIHSCTKMRYKAEYKPSCLLCPRNMIWVDFSVAKYKMDMAAPHHCCTLSQDYVGKKKEEGVDDDGDACGGVNSDAGGDCAMDNRQYITQKRSDGDGNGEEDIIPSLSEIVEGMYLDIGQQKSQQNDNNADGKTSDVAPSTTVTVGMLNGYGRKIVDPLMEEFVTQVGVSVSRRCIIKL